MPTYEYACEACENTWEAEQRITEPALKDCPKCNEPKARRLISGSRFVLKGSGWYADGYGSKPANKGKGDASPDAKSNGSGEAKSDSKAETKSESKAETKSDSKPASTTASKSGSSTADS